MYKWIIIGLLVAGVALYLSGALDVDTRGDSVDISLDKSKAEELAKSVKEKVEE